MPLDKGECGIRYVSLVSVGDPDVCMRTYLSKRDESERDDESVEICIAPT